MKLLTHLIFSWVKEFVYVGVTLLLVLVITISELCESKE
jgi:protein-S-isoprenylcysteine O-methyltransferase Ste14